MAKLEKKQVEHVARLALLPLSSKELPLFQAQLSEVVDYINKISEVETKEVKAKHEARNVSRKDQTEGPRTLSQEKATSQAKNVHKGLFVVPAIFEEV